MESLNRREFLILAGSGAAAVTSLGGCKGGLVKNKNTTAAKRPNILWISTEDISPDLGCYGDDYAVTPNIDAFAKQAVRYTNVYSHSGVCAPTRSGIITGMYPTTIGTCPMRCKGVPLAYVKCFSEYLRAAGYYCTNNVKTDYQFDPPLTAWDENSRKAHWRGRAKDQPFFAVFNITTTHESQIRNRSEGFLKRLASLKPHEKHDPSKATLPPYYPDTPLVREDWAQYHDIITLMDKQFADILKQLEDDGLADDTIVWFWGDHGRGLPRAKRWIYDSGLLIPLIISVPKKLRKVAMPNNPGTVQPGSVNDDLIAFIDFAPTMLSLAGVEIPAHIQGRAFLGSRKAEQRQYIFAARDRMDEAYDIIRAVRDKRFKYIRNYMPYLTYGQDIEYMNMMPTMQEMRRLNAEGRLVGPQKQYFLETKPIEELYDTLTDPHEVNNLADDPKYSKVLKRLRKVHQKWMKETCDVGLIPEPEFDQMKRPGEKYQNTAEPTFSVIGGNDTFVRISCATAGASIAYKTNSESGPGWKLYTKPVMLKPDQMLIAKACRIGFKDSNEATFKLGDKQSKSKQANQTEENIPHWKDQLKKTDLLKRLRSIKSLDGLGEKAVPKYFEALRDKYGSVRYWAVVGLKNNCNTDRQRKQAKQAIAQLLHDPSPIVRIASAETMCNWDQQKQSLEVLVELLQNESRSVQLNAAIALDRIGEKARPVISHIEAASKDPDEYVQKIARHTLRYLQSY